ncbi:MAG: hypothetical protein ACE5EX_10155 [Phycisphaerae bacterium]
MRKRRSRRVTKALVPGLMLLQVAGCDVGALNESLQTLFLGITAAGSLAILRNI